MTPLAKKTQGGVDRDPHRGPARYGLLGGSDGRVLSITITAISPPTFSSPRPCRCPPDPRAFQSHRSSASTRLIGLQASLYAEEMVAVVPMTLTRHLSYLHPPALQEVDHPSPPHPENSSPDTRSLASPRLIGAKASLCADGGQTPPLWHSRTTFSMFALSQTRKSAFGTRRSPLPPRRDPNTRSSASPRLIGT